MGFITNISIVSKTLDSLKFNIIRVQSLKRPEFSIQSPVISVQSSESTVQRLKSSVQRPKFVSRNQEFRYATLNLVFMFSMASYFSCFYFREILRGIEPVLGILCFVVSGYAPVVEYSNPFIYSQ